MRSCWDSVNTLKRLVVYRWMCPYVKQTRRGMKNDMRDMHCRWVAALINNSMWSLEEKSVLQVSYSKVNRSKDTISYFSNDSHLSTAVRNWQEIRMMGVIQMSTMQGYVWRHVTCVYREWPGLMPAGKTFLHDWWENKHLFSAPVQKDFFK